MKSAGVRMPLFALLSLTLTGTAATLNAPSAQYASISAALMRSKSGDTVMVADGTYRETLVVPAGVTLMARNLLKAEIRSGKRGACITAGGEVTVQGFVISQGTIGVMTRGTGNRIEKCMIARSSQSGVLSVGVLPALQDNLIVFNGGSGIQGQDLRSTSASVNHNTIAYNTGHGIALSGNSNIVVENNIIAFNEKFAISTSGPGVQYTAIANNFCRNGAAAPLPAGTISEDPLFVNARKMDFTLGESSPCRGRAADNGDIGARIGRY